MRLPLVVDQVGMIKLSIWSTIRGIRLSPPQSPSEVVISDRSPSWKLLAEAVEGSPLAKIETTCKKEAKGLGGEDLSKELNSNELLLPQTREEG